MKRVASSPEMVFRGTGNRVLNSVNMHSVITHNASTSTKYRSAPAKRGKKDRDDQNDSHSISPTTSCTISPAHSPNLMLQIQKFNKIMTGRLPNAHAKKLNNFSLGPGRKGKGSKNNDNNSRFGNTSISISSVSVSGGHREYETLVPTKTRSYMKLSPYENKIQTSRIYGRITKSLIPFLMASHTKRRPVWLVRSACVHGQQIDTGGENRMFAKPVSPLLEIGARGTKFAKWLSEFIRKKTSGLSTVRV